MIKRWNDSYVVLHNTLFSVKNVVPSFQLKYCCTVCTLYNTEEASGDGYHVNQGILALLVVLNTHLCSVVDPDTYSGASWIRIRIPNTDSDQKI